MTLKRNRILLTTFEPYGSWSMNASSLAVDALAGRLPEAADIIVRRYPVDFEAAEPLLAADLAAGYDFALHVGQAPGSAAIRLEAIGINVCGRRGAAPGRYEPLVAAGPVAYRTALPVERWAGELREAGIRAEASYHAGTYLCNAVFYWTQHFAQQHGLRTQALFVHVPLECSQVDGEANPQPSLSAEISAAALRLLLEQMVALKTA